MHLCTLKLITCVYAYIGIICKQYSNASTAIPHYGLPLACTACERPVANTACKISVVSTACEIPVVSTAYEIIEEVNESDLRMSPDEIPMEFLSNNDNVYVESPGR